MPERRKLAQGRRRHRANSRCCCFFGFHFFSPNFPGRKGAREQGAEERRIHPTGLRYFSFVWTGYEIFHAKPLSFAHTHACALTLILTTLGEPSKDTLSHILFYLSHWDTQRPTGRKRIKSYFQDVSMYFYKDQSKCWEGRDFSWLRWDLGAAGGPKDLSAHIYFIERGYYLGGIMRFNHC